MITPYLGLAKAAKVETLSQLADSYGDWQGIRTNHVTTANGMFQDEAESSRGISTPEDRELLLELRRRADLVLVDARTARSEGYRPITGTTLGVISQSGDFQGLKRLYDHPGVIFFSATATSAVEASIIGQSNPFFEILVWAKECGKQRILLEAGPTLSRLAFSHNQVKQAALTTTPNVDASEVRLPFESGLKIISLAQGSGATFSLWG